MSKNSKILLEKTNGDLHCEVEGTNEDQVRSLVGYALNVPNGAANMVAALELAAQLSEDPEFMKSMMENTKVHEARWTKDK